MNYDEILKTIISRCVAYEIDIQLINNDTDLVSEFGFSSVNIVQLVVEIENTFKIEISDEDMQIEKLSNYGLLISIIRETCDKLYSQ